MISMSSGLKIMLAASLAASPTMTTAQACQGTGCVLPLQAPAPPPPAPVYTPPPAPPAAPVEVIPEEVASKGLGILPFVIGAALIAAILYFVLDNDDDDDVEVPESP